MTGLTTTLGLRLPSPLQSLPLPSAIAAGVTCYVKRDDLIHPVVSGNKWRKLSGYLDQAAAQGVRHILSFGGPFSNHLHALAGVAQAAGLQATGIVRGELWLELTPTLIDCVRWGMHLSAMARPRYRRLRDEAGWQEIGSIWPDALIVPEGGAGPLGLLGVAEIWSELAGRVDDIVLAVGTGTTLAGLVASAPRGARVIGVPVVNALPALTATIEHMTGESPGSRWCLVDGFHAGGFARPAPWAEEVRRHWAAFGVSLDPVYGVKVARALDALLAGDYFPPGRRVALLHTGGLQGARSHLA